MKTWLNDFVSLIFPRLCICCENFLIKGEEMICVKCLVDLPYTGYIGSTENEVAKIFKGRLEIFSASSLLHFEHGNATQMIMHELKYKNNPEIGRLFGKVMGAEMKKIHEYQSIDAIIPIPIHSSKLRNRGYNQSDFIASGISEELGVEVRTRMVKRVLKTSSQTKKGRYDRWENVQNVFEFCGNCHEKLNHILIVDDVITTGATIETCARSILSNLETKISVATLARSA